jgi:hypothetical protein
MTKGRLVNMYMCHAAVALSTKWALRAVNFFSSVKIVVLVLYVPYAVRRLPTDPNPTSMVLTGFAVLSGLTSIEDPYANFKNPFEGSSFNGNALAMALVSPTPVLNLSHC